MRRYLPILAAAMLFGNPANAAPDVVVSIKPLHSLVAAVMDGVAQPKLLLEGNASPHSYSLRPSDAKAISEADLVFVVGGGLEGFLDKPLANLGAGRVVALADAPEIERLPLREGGMWDDHGHHHHGHKHDHKHGHKHAHGDEFDNHLWLSPQNAKAFLAAAAEALAKADPDNAAAYRRNAETTQAAVVALEDEIAGRLEPVRTKPYIVFHDAYHYFENRFGLTPAGAITINPERQPGAKRVKEIQDRIRAGGAVCIFREPQFSPQLIERLATPQVKVGVLDPLGAELPAGPDAWFETMRGLAANLSDCLAG